MRPPHPKLLLVIIVFSQFAGTSLWFAGNAVTANLLPHAGSGVASLTSMVQIGFIAGTLVFSVLALADRLPASLIFFISCLLGAMANWSLLFFAGQPGWLYLMRFITGFFLAGIYPVGMKIAADCFPQKLGSALGFLVGALVLGTAFPHFMKARPGNLDWKEVIRFTSMLAVLGGLLVLLLVPRHSLVSNKWKFGGAFGLFRNTAFRSAAFGYFGHMWELYAFWAFVPVILAIFTKEKCFGINIPFWSFMTIAVGGLSCVIGGLLSKRFGSRMVALCSLILSGGCCLLLPFTLHFPMAIFLFLLIFWGATVVSDSPQFSTLVAQSVPAEQKGTALTLVTCIGFAITILSIQLLGLALDSLGEKGLWLLLPGPLFGIFSLRKKSV